MGLNAIGFTIYSLPADPQGPVEHLQMIAWRKSSRVSRPTRSKMHD